MKNFKEIKTTTIGGLMAVFFSYMWYIEKIDTIAYVPLLLIPISLLFASDKMINKLLEMLYKKFLS